MIDRTKKGHGGRCAFYILGSIFMLGWAIFFTKSFIATTVSYAYVMGFFKLFFLGTTGEILKYRIVKHHWTIDYIFERSLVWGLFGVWFTAAFPFFAGGTSVLVEKGLWPGMLLPLSRSAWINGFGMFAWGMMVIHEYFNFLIKYRWKVVNFARFARESDWEFLVGFIWKTIFWFWLPAHTITFLLPSEWRVLSAAVLAIALGFFLSVGKARKTIIVDKRR